MPIIRLRGEWERSLAETRRQLDAGGVSRRETVRDALADAADDLVEFIDANVGRLGTDRLDQARLVRSEADELDSADPDFAAKAAGVRSDLDRLIDDTGAPVTIMDFEDEPATRPRRETNRDVIRRRIVARDFPDDRAGSGAVIIDELLDAEAPRSAFHRRQNNSMLATIAGVLLQPAPAPPAPQPLSATASPPQIAASAAGPRVESGPVTVTPAGGKPPYSFRWSAEANAVGAAQPDDEATTRFVLENVDPGETIGSGFTCAVTDADGQTTSVRVPASFANVATTPAPLTAVADPTAVEGDESSDRFETEPTTVSPVGGSPPYSFAWSGPTSTGARATDPDAATTTFVTAGLQPGEEEEVAFTCTVTDAAGISAAAVVIATFRNAAAVGAPLDATADPSVVEGDDPENEFETDSATVTPTGGRPPYNFAWSGPTSSGARATDPDAATTAFTIDFVPENESISVEFVCTVTDGDGDSVTVPVTAIFDNQAEPQGELGVTVVPDHVRGESAGEGDIETDEPATAELEGAQGEPTFLWEIEEGSGEPVDPEAQITFFRLPGGADPGVVVESRFRCTVTVPGFAPVSDTVDVTFERVGDDGDHPDEEAARSPALPELIARHLPPAERPRFADALAAAGIDSLAGLAAAGRDGRRSAPFKSEGQVVRERLEQALRLRGDPNAERLPDAQAINGIVKEAKRYV